MTEENRYDMFSNYFKQIIKKPQKIILFNLDGIFEIFLSMEETNRKILSKSIRNAFELLDEESKHKMVLFTPDIARDEFTIYPLRAATLASSAVFLKSSFLLIQSENNGVFNK